MSVLVIAEHDNASLGLGTLSVVTAAGKLGGDVHVLVAGSGCQAVADAAAKVAGVGKVLLADDGLYANYLAENMAELVLSLAGDYGHILAPASTFGKDFMPRVAVKLDVAQISDIIEVVSAKSYVRPIYAGNALATVESSDDKQVVTVRPTAFDKAAAEGGSASVEAVASAADAGVSSFVGKEESKSDRPELSSAEIVISGGRGVGSEEAFKVIYDTADALGAAVGASRAAVDAGYISNDHQVGQTGKVVAPQLYIAAGISGAIQHLAGMKESKVIVAINTDENAPIFEVADYGLVGDLFEVLPEIQSKL